MSLDRPLAQKAILDLLKSLGHDPEQEPELKQTPALVVEALERDWLCGYSVDIGSLFASAVKNTLANAPIVVVSGLAVGTLCPHHLLPAEGTATVAYLPGGTLLGLGTIARLVDAYSRRLTLQEQLGQNVILALLNHSGAKGAYCRLDLRHACLRLRGPKQGDAVVTTTHVAGDFESLEGRERLAEALRGENSEC